MKRLWLDPTVISLGVIVAIAALFGYWLFWPDVVVVIKNPTAVKTDKRIYHRGERIIYVLDYCKTRAIQGRVTRSLVDGIVIPYATITNDLPVGCRKVFVYDLVIPDYTPPGTYHLEVSGEYRVNPLKTNSNSWRTEDFEVVDSPNEPLEKLQQETDKNTEDIEKHHKEDKAWQRKHSGLCVDKYGVSRNSKGERTCLSSI